MRKATISAALTAAIALGAAAPSHAAHTWGADLAKTPDQGCDPACVVHTKVHGSGVLDSGSPGAGVVTKVQLKHKGEGGSAALVVLKAKGANQFENRGTVPILIDEHPTAAVQSFSTRFRVGLNERVALNVKQGVLGDLVMAGADPDAECYIANPHSIGSTKPYASGSFCSATVLLKATVEPDIDNDGYGDETQDTDLGTPGEPEPEPTPDPQQQPQPVDGGQQSGPTQQPEAPAATSPVDPNPPCVVDKLGTKRRDALKGSSAGDRLHGLAASDLLDGMGGDDCLFGGAGNDRLVGGDGGDRLYGGKDQDRLHGGRGDDRLFGESGRDVIAGGYGDDVVSAAGGKRDRDRINCGPGADVAYVDGRDEVNGCERVERSKG
jgi:hypothetical protein